MSLKGLPDFQQPLRGEDFLVFYPYESAKDFLICPNQLEIALRNDELPEFSLEFVRGPTPMHPPKPYGVLDFLIRPLYSMDKALDVLRGKQPDAMLKPIIFTGGFLRFQLLEDSEELPAELKSAFPLSWNSLGVTRVILRLSEDAALFFKGFLKGDMIGLVATAEMEIFGVSPRLPVKINFNPKDMLNSLASLADNTENLFISRTEIFKFFQKDLETLPLQLEGNFDTLDRNDFAEAMADRIRVKFGKFMPSPDQGFEPYLELIPLEDISDGNFQWDLSEALKVPRPHIMNLDPLETARLVVKRFGIDKLVKETTVPLLPTGVLPISVSINLPSNRIGVISIGVEIHVPPKPPYRPFAITETVEFVPPEDSSSVFLRLSPTEKPEYIYSAYIVTQDSEGIRRLDGPEISHSGNKLLVDLEDFPVSFVPIEASQGLLNIAKIKGVCKWSVDDDEAKQSFEIETSKPDLVLPLPKEAEKATLEIETSSIGGSKTLKLDSIPAQALRLGLHSFREYGPHNLEIECIFDDESKIFAIDLLSESSTEESENIDVLHFTTKKTKAEWSYLAPSPFESGYRFRPHAEPDEPTHDWSELLSPFEPLTVYSSNSKR